MGSGLQACHSATLGKLFCLLPTSASTTNYLVMSVSYIPAVRCWNSSAPCGSTKIQLTFTFNSPCPAPWVWVATIPRNSTLTGKSICPRKALLHLCCPKLLVFLHLKYIKVINITNTRSGIWLFTALGYVLRKTLQGLEQLNHSECTGRGGDGWTLYLWRWTMAAVSIRVKIKVTEKHLQYISRRKTKKPKWINNTNVCNATGLTSCQIQLLAELGHYCLVLVPVETFIFSLSCHVWLLFFLLKIYMINLEQYSSQFLAWAGNLYSLQCG